MRHSFVFTVCCLAILSSESAADLISTELKLAPPRGWKLASRKPDYRVLFLNNPKIANWEAEAELCEIRLKPPGATKPWGEVEGFGLPDVFEVLDEKIGDQWKVTLFLVRKSPDTYIQMIRVRGALVTMCNFRLREVAGRPLPAIEKEVPLLNQELLKVARAIGVEVESIVQSKDGLLRIGDSWGVLLQEKRFRK